MGLKKNRIDIVVSVILVCTLLISCWSICGINFETNDDTGIMMFVTGAKTGTPTADTIFCNVLWGGLLASLYRINESIPWYIIIYLALMTVTCSVVCISCVRVFDLRKEHDYITTDGIKRCAAGLVFFVMLFYSVFVYYAVMFQFTTIAALCGVAASLLMVSAKNSRNVPEYVLFTLFLFFSDTIRPKVGYMVSLSILLTVVAMFFLQKRVDRVFVIVALIVQILTFVVNTVYERLNGWQPFRKYHLARAYWKDYPHYSFQENPSLYESVGWTDKLYKLADKWFFMDRRINAESFKKIDQEIDIPSYFSVNALKTFVMTSQLRMTLLVVIVIIIIAIIMAIRGHMYRMAIAIVGGVVLHRLSSYISYIMVVFHIGSLFQ